MGYVRRDNRQRDGLLAEGVRTLDEPMEATLADRSGLARMTWTISGSREAGDTWLVGTIEFVGYGVQVLLEDPMLRFDQVREFGQSLWQISDRQGGDSVEARFEPFLTVRARAPSRLAARVEVDLEFVMGTDARVTTRLDSEGTLTMAFVEALDRALEAVDDLD